MEVWIFIFLFLLALNFSVSIMIIRRGDLNSFQKGTQVAMIWIIPITAAIGLWLFHRSNDDNKPGGGPIGGGPNDSIRGHVGGD